MTNNTIIDQQNDSQQYTSRELEHPIPWWYFVLGIDAFLVLITVAYRSLPSLPGKGILGYTFNLGLEMNLAAWWSGICLATIGLLAFEFFILKDGKTRNAWLVFAILMLGLSLDEVGSLHEIASWSMRLPYAVILCLMLLYSVKKLMSDPQTKKSAILITVAFFLYGSVALQEYLQFAVSWPEWAKGPRVGVEEGTELLATFLLFLSIVPHRKFQTNSIRVIIPRLYSIPYIRIIILVGVFLNIGSAFIFPELLSISVRGYPLAWYPMTLFFILFCASFWMSLEHRKDRRYWSSLAVIFIMCSASIMWDPISSFSIIRGIVPEKGVSYFLYVTLLFIIAIRLFQQKSIAFQEILLTLLPSILILILSLLYYLIMKSMPTGVWSLFSSCYGLFIFYIIEKMKSLHGRQTS